MYRKKMATVLLTVGTAMTLVCAPDMASAQRHDNFYNGVRDGGRGGSYNGRDRGDRGRYDDHRGGIGPGKGALIGAGGGAVLGAVLGGGLKGSIIGGAAGAGIGAIAGNVHQNNRRRNDYYRR